MGALNYCRQGRRAGRAHRDVCERDSHAGSVSVPARLARRTKEGTRYAGNNSAGAPKARGCKGRALTRPLRGGGSGAAERLHTQANATTLDPKETFHRPQKWIQKPKHKKPAISKMAGPFPGLHPPHPTLARSKSSAYSHRGCVTARSARTASGRGWHAVPTSPGDYARPAAPATSRCAGYAGSARQCRP